jgi:hypothetical protein
MTALNASSSAASLPPATTASPLNALSNDTQSFGFLEYFLRLSLHASTAKIVNSWEVSNPQLTLQFEKRAKDVLTLDAWVDVTQLPANNTEDDTIRRGFQFNSSGAGIKFSVGRIKLDESGKEGIIRKRMLLCKIAVGRAYNATEDFAKIAALPEGYDSFVIDRERVQLTKDLDSDALQELEYILKDSTQILPTYVVVFEYDAEMERRSRQKSVCENCESQPAAVFCQADSANLCQSCDSQLHSSKLTCRHVRTPLDAGPQTFSACRQHPDKLVEFFCPTCSRPVCVHCKMVGHHSTGDAARHKLITVAEAFRGVSDSAGASDPLLLSRKQKIEAQVVSVSERVKTIEANATNVGQQLEELYKKALSDLKSITKKKLNVLKGDMVELHREAAEIGQLESFLEYQKTGGNATQFILDWANHQKLRSELHSFVHFREGIDVQPDIKINGAIQVHVDAGEADQMRQSSLIDGRPRYTQSPGRLRNTPTVDFSSLTKTRKPTDHTESTILAKV